MRRLLALTALVAMTWPHVAVMECAAMDSAPAPHASSFASEHTHAGPGCPALMTCSSSMAEGVAGGAIAAPSAPSHVIGAVATVAPTGTVLTAEPPPPRRHA